MAETAANVLVESMIIGPNNIVVLVFTILLWLTFLIGFVGLGMHLRGFGRQMGGVYVTIFNCYACLCPDIAFRLWADSRTRPARSSQPEVKGSSVADGSLNEMSAQEIEQAERNSSLTSDQPEVVVVTGASAGLGRAIVRTFIQ